VPALRKSNISTRKTKPSYKETIRRYRYILNSIKPSYSSTTRLNSLLISIDKNLETSRIFKEDSFLRELIEKNKDRPFILALLYSLRYKTLEELFKKNLNLIKAIKG